MTKAQDHISDDALLQAMQAGDEQAFATLYRRRHRGIFRFVLHMGGSQEVAEDVTQEVFMMLIREAHRFDQSRGSLNAFLLGVARNHLLRRLQRERFYAPLETDDGDAHIPAKEDPLNQLTRIETIDSVRNAVLSLPERYREAIVLCDLEEMSYAEAALVLDCAIGTVRSRLHRGRALLIEKLRGVKSDQTAGAKTARCFA